LEDCSKDENVYQQFKQLETESYQRAFQDNFRDEAYKIIHDPANKELLEYLPVDLNGITDAKKLEEAKRRNVRFVEKEKRLGEVVAGFNGGPRSAAKWGLSLLRWFRLRPQFNIARLRKAMKSALGTKSNSGSFRNRSKHYERTRRGVMLHLQALLSGRIQLP
jgi:hypothetical protein